MSRRTQQTKARIQAHHLSGKLSARFATSETARRGVVVGPGLVRVEGHIVKSAIDAPAGALVDVVNSGRAADPLYVLGHSKSGAAVITGGGGGSGGGSTGGTGIHALDSIVHTGTLSWIRVNKSASSLVDLAAHDHDLLTGLSQDDHTQYMHISTARTVTAQHTFSPGSAAAPFALGANAQGQTVIGLKADQLNRTMTAGAGLTGLGILTEDRTVAVGAGNGITVNADDVAVDQAYSFGWSGRHTFGTYMAQFTGGTAPASGTGLEIGWSAAAGHILAYDRTGTEYHPLRLGGSQVRITAGGSESIVTVASTTVTMDADLTFAGAQSITTSSGALTISPVANLVLDPGGLVELPNAQEARTTAFSDLVTGITGTRLWDAGSNQRWLVGYGAKFDELHVRVFVADETRVDRGAEYWSKSFGIVETGFTMPALDATVDVWFEDAAGVGSNNLFSVDDWLLLRSIDWSTGLTVYLVWLQVVSKLDDDAAADGTTRQQWQIRRKSGGATGTAIKKGTLLLDVGQAGQGWVHLSALTGDGGPFVQVGDWSGANPYTSGNFKPRARMGHLSGFGGLGTGVYGIAAAKDGSVAVGSGYEGFAVDAANGARFWNIGISLYNSSVQTVSIAKTGDIWVGPSSADKRFVWDNAGALLSVKGAITITAPSSGIGNFFDGFNDRQRWIDSFEDAAIAGVSGRWKTDYSGGGEMSLVAGEGDAGGQILRIGNNSGNDQRWMIGTENIPFDANVTYRVRIRVRRTAGTGTVVAGLAGVAADGTTLVNTAGANTHSLQHYIAASNQAPDATWTEYVGYVRGRAATGTGSVRANLNSPGVLHTDVRYIRPLLLVNYNGAAGTTDVDFVEIAAVSGHDVLLHAIRAGAVGGPNAAGLWLGANELGHYDGAGWTTRIDSSGNLFLKTSTGARLEFDAASNELRGYNSGGTKQWYAGGTDGKVYFGGGKGLLDVSGMAVASGSSPGDVSSGIAWYGTPSSRSSHRALIGQYSAVEFGNVLRIESLPTTLNGWIELVATGNDSSASILLQTDSFSTIQLGASLINSYGKLSMIEVLNQAKFRISDDWTPASASATGTKGDITWDANFVYVCTATNTWKRATLSSWSE